MMRHGGGTKRLFNSHTGTGSAVSNIASTLVPVDGHIVGVQFAVRAGSNFGQFAVIDLELSYSQVNALGLNDQSLVIATFSQNLNFTTSGESIAFLPQYQTVPMIPVMAGTSIYLHAQGTNTLVFNIYAHVYFDFATVIVAAPLR